MKHMFMLFVSLSLGYGLLILARKEKKGLIRTVGYTLGTGIIALSLLLSLISSCAMSKNMLCGKMKAGMKGRAHARCADTWINVTE